MGYIYTTNPATGRPALCCDCCGGFPARKYRCPVNWCQAIAMCKLCKRDKWPQVDHSYCHTRHNELEAAKAYVQVGGLTIHLSLREAFGRPYYVIEDDSIGFAVCSLFNKTFVDEEVRSKLEEWGNKVEIRP